MRPAPSWNPAVITCPLGDLAWLGDLSLASLTRERCEDQWESRQSPMQEQEGGAWGRSGREGLPGEGPGRSDSSVGILGGSPLGAGPASTFVDDAWKAPSEPRGLTRPICKTRTR